jgi:hypothetical protein
MEVKTFELAFAKFIEKFHEQIKENFLEDSVNNRGLLSRRPNGRKILEDLADNVYSEFARNIDRKTTPEEIAERYTGLGKQCNDEGVSFSEMVRVFILLRRHVWLFFQESDFAGQRHDVRSIVALNNRTTLFFDRAMYGFLVGFEQAAFKDRSDLERLYESFVERLRRDVAKRSGPVE